MIKGERSGYRQDPLISVVHRDTTLWQRERGKKKEKGDLVQAAHRYISLTAKGKEYGASRDPTRRAGKTPGHANHAAGGKAQSAGQAETPSRRAETLTLEGTNQGIKESGHRSRRPPAHKGYNQFIKDARRSQRAAQLSQLKPMEGKIWSLTQRCRNANRE